jgi:hypothetical protein
MLLVFTIRKVLLPVVHCFTLHRFTVWAFHTPQAKATVYFMPTAFGLSHDAPIEQVTGGNSRQAFDFRLFSWHIILYGFQAAAPQFVRSISPLPPSRWHFLSPIRLLWLPVLLRKPIMH